MDRYKITIETFNKQADIYQDKFMDISLYKETFDIFCELISKPDAKIFEIGCGPGNITKYLLSKRPDLKIKAIDLAPNMIRLAKENNPEADFMLMDCRKIRTLTEKFDGIMCGFCLPYLSKEECIKLMSDCSFLLNSGGIVYFSTMEGDYSTSGYEMSSNGQDKCYINYHQEDYFQAGLKENNLELLELSRIKYAKANGAPVTDLIILAKKM